MATGPLIAIVGQTASGKTALALELARRFNGEIICADARTVYKGMDIGTAKPTTEEQAGVPHHLLDIVEPDQPITVADFKPQALNAINDIAARDKLPIMVGGTGLYIDAVLFDYAFDSGQERDSVNPRHAKVAGGRGELRPNTLVLGLDVAKETLDRNIERRVQDMISQGLEAEARGLAATYGWDAPGLNTIGYKEWQPAPPAGADVVETIVKNTRAYAKRQKTWFKRNKSIQWLSNPQAAVEIVTTFLNKSR